MNVVAQAKHEREATGGPRRRSRISALVLAAVLLAAGVALAKIAPGQAHAKRQPGSWCGGQLWRLMTLSDPDRRRVDFDDSTTTIAEIAKLTPPDQVTTARSSHFQRHVWRLRTVIDRYRMASNGEIVLILYSIDSAQYMDAYMPNPNCLSPSTRYRAGLLAARRAFVRACPQPTPNWQLLGATIDLAGVGFWNPNKTTRGALPNGAELRPLTAFKIIAGCGIG
jgi:hypothetical protein